MGVGEQTGKHRLAAGGETGFTIIEVTLFLAISGLLAVLLLGGWTAMLNTQRYKDSTRTFQSFLQQQYNLVYNVENGRGDELICSESGAGGELTVSQRANNDLTGKTERGQSRCVIMGRYIHIKNGNEVKVSSIVGYDQANDTSSSDLESIRLFKPARVDFEIGLSDNELNIPWQAEVRNPGDSVPRSYVIAIIRTPLTGIVHTFSQRVADGNNEENEDGGDILPKVTTMVESPQSNSEQNDLTLCLDPGGALAGGSGGISIKSYASSQSAIQLIPGGDSRCT